MLYEVITLGVVPRFASAHLETHNKAVNGVYKTFTSLEDGVLSQVPDIKLNGTPDRDDRLPNTLNVSFAYIEGESLLV